jgi:DNA-binding transcriptional ArsR family regulator
MSPELLQRSDLQAEAVLLYEFLVDQQTSPDGKVFYGKPVSYAWIRSRYLRGSLRSLERHMRALKDAGYVEAHREFHGGMRIRLPRSIKFRKAQPPPAVQLTLYSPAPTPIRGGKPVDKPVGKQWESCGNPENNTATGGGIVPPRVAVERSRKQVKEKIKTLSTATSLPREEDAAALVERRRLLAVQARTIQEKYKTSLSGKAKAQT